MSVTNMLKTILLVLFLFQSLQAQTKSIGNIGFVSPNYPDFGQRVSQDILEFFEEIMETGYNSYSDAGLTVLNRYNIPRGQILFKDMKYNHVALFPSEDNRDMIEEFYENKGLDFKRALAQENKVEIFLYSKFQKSKLKKVIRQKRSKSTITYQISAYGLQNNATSRKYITFDVTDLFDVPDYDPDELQALFIKEYILIFKELIQFLQTVGAAPTTSQEEANVSSGEDKQTAENTQTAEADDNQGDW